MYWTPSYIWLTPWRNGCCGWVPCFLVSRPFRSHDEFFVVVRSYSILERFTRSNDVLTLDNEYISLVVRIGLFRPNKVLTPVYKWICTLQWWRVWLTLDKRPVVRRPISSNPGLNFNPGFFFFCLKSFSRIIFSILFRASNHLIADQKN